MMHLFRDYFVVKKSTAAFVALAAAAGCLLYKYYKKPGNDLLEDVESVAEKGKETVKKVARDAK